MLVLHVSLAKTKGITEDDDLAIDVLDHNGKCFCCSVNLLIAAEVRDDGIDGQVNS